MFEIKSQGVVERIEDPREWTSKDGKAKFCRNVVIRETKGKYPKQLLFTFWGHDAAKVDGVSVGDEVLATGKASSREAMREDGSTYWTTRIAGIDLRLLSPSVVDGGRDDGNDDGPDEEAWGR